MPKYRYDKYRIKLKTSRMDDEWYEYETSEEELYIHKDLMEEEETGRTFNEYHIEYETKTLKGITRYRVGDLFGMTSDEHERYLEKHFGSTGIYFEDKKQVIKAFEWVESMLLLNKLTGGASSENI